jgi:hypothetical protein
VGIQAANATIVSVTYGGVSRGAPFQSGIATTNNYLFGLANPPAGAQTITITVSATGAYVEAGAVTVTGSNTSTVFDSTNSATATSTAPSVAVTSATGEFVVDFLGTFSGATSFTQSGSQTLRWGPLSAGGDRGMGSTAPAAAGSTTMSWTLGGSAEWVLLAGSFKK